MNTSLTNNEPKLLVDLETGRVLRGDEAPVVSRRYVDSHPFIELVEGSRADTLFVGPDARRRKLARQRGEGEATLDAWEYEIQAEVAGSLRLQRVVEA